MTCSKGPPAGIEPGSAAYVACAPPTRPPARPSKIDFDLEKINETVRYQRLDTDSLFRLNLN